jgi:hypothetical protein
MGSRPDGWSGSACDSLPRPLPSQGRREGEGAAPASPHNTFTPDRRVRFLDHLAIHGNVRAACASVGISAETAYRARRRDFAFGEGWAAALVLARASAEQVLADRALNGVAEAIFYRGELVGTRLRFDGRLLLAHLARLDRLSVEELAGARAARFDELLALVAGETFDEDMADRPRDARDTTDPLLPMARERYLIEAESAAAIAGRDEALDEIVAAAEGDGRDLPGIGEWRRSEAALTEAEAEVLDAAEYDAAAQGRADAEALWSDWRARVRAVADRLEIGGDGGEAEPALDPVHSVNTPLFNQPVRV